MVQADCIHDIYEKNDGILRFWPIFIPRQFSKAGRRLRLHPDDYYALGTSRGSIKERWFSSIIPAMNGSLAKPDEGMSYIQTDEKECNKILFKDFVDVLGVDLLGNRIMDQYGTWPMYSKFFDFEDPLFFHLHLSFEDAMRVGKKGKPEAYYFPLQYNAYLGNFPHTYFGLLPGITRDDVKARLAIYTEADNRMTEISHAYRIQLGTGWYTPPGVLHAPGSVLTYEPQWNSDVNSVFENITSDEIYTYRFLAENCPDQEQGNLDYIMDLLDWKANQVADYYSDYFRPPIVASKDENHIEKWISYGNDYVAAKELTVYPGKTYISRDITPYGCIFVQGHGKFGLYDAETPTMIRFGQSSQDEYFVGIGAAEKGVLIVNTSMSEPIVILKHFPACNPDTPIKS